MKTMGYKQSLGDQTLFIKHLASRGVIALIVYVDVIVVTSNDKTGVKALKRCLITKFEIKELARLKYFFRIDVAHSHHGIFISQQNVVDLLAETSKFECKPTKTPFKQNHKLGE